MRVAVLGAAGKVGRLVVEGLVAEGHQVVGLVRSDEQAALISGLGAAPSKATSRATSARC